MNRLLASTVILLSLALGTCSEALATQCERPQRLRYSMVPDGDVEKDLARLAPLLDRLGTSLGMPVETVTPSSYGAVIDLLLTGRIDVARLGPAAYLTARRSNAGITAFATTLQHFGAYQEQGAFYRSLLVVQAGGRFQTVNDLRGASLALVDPNSTSGNKIPRTTFRHVLGTELDNHFSRIAYAGGHKAAANMVLDGRADAAFVASTQLSAMAAAGELKPRQVRVLWRSPPVPMDPYVYRGTLCEDIKDKIRATFLAGSAANAQVLSDMRALAFVPVRDSDYDVLKDR